MRNNPFLNFCLWFCLANGLLYLLSPGTRERYLYMFFPYIYAILAFALHEMDEISWFKKFYLFIGISVAAGLIGIGVFGLTLNFIIPSILCLLMALIVAAALYYIRLSSSYTHLLASVLIILVARIGFDLVVLPTKKKNDPYRSDAQNMARLIGIEPIYLSGTPQPRIDEIKLAGKHFITFKRDEPAFLAFQTSFYLSRFTGRILKYTTAENLPGFYISNEKFKDPAMVDVYYKFNNKLDKEDNWYILYKPKAL